MGSVLLLYDTIEKDLARDFKDLLTELNMEINMIPLSPNLGKTLQSKEGHYFDSVDGAIFLITPGSERMGKLFPSPSVADEMGQAKQKFKNKPERVTYLVDANCNIQAIDQKSYIQFNRKDIRTVLEAITLLIKDLKQSGLFRKKKIEQRETPGIDIAKYSESVDEKLKKLCFDLSDKPSGFIISTDFDNLLKTKYKMSNRDVNFIKRDIQTKGLVAYYQSNTRSSYAGWRLSNIGFELVRHEIRKAKQAKTNSFLEVFKKSAELSYGLKNLKSLMDKMRLLPKSLRQKNNEQYSNNHRR